MAPATGTPAAVPTAVEEAGEETLGRHHKVGRLKCGQQGGGERERESERTVATGAPPAAMAAPLWCGQSASERARRNGVALALG